MFFRNLASNLERVIAPLTLVVSYIAACVLGVMSLLTVADVVGRYIFNKPIPGTFELGEFQLAIIVFFGIAYCGIQRGHVTIGLVVSRLRQRTQDVIDSIMYAFFFIFLCLLSWQLYKYAIELWHNGFRSSILKLPVFPSIFVAAFGCTLLSVVVLIHLLLFLNRALGK